MPKVLVTGHAGFVGRTLASEASAGHLGADWQTATIPETLDLRDPSLPDSIAAVKPDAVIHLAALTSVADSFGAADAYFDVNFRGTLCLLRALKQLSFTGKLLFVSSGDCYGMVAEGDLPISERLPLRPRSPYAVSKVAAEALCYQWSQTEGMDIVMARPFNHIGPGQDKRFAVAGFARQLAQIAVQGAKPVIMTGDLGVTRDFSDVRDVVRAYAALIRRGLRGGVYNVGSGRETSLQQMLDGLIALAGVPVKVEVDQTRMRAGEQRRVIADVTRIRSETGWSAQMPLADTLRDTLDWWKGVVARG